MTAEFTDDARALMAMRSLGECEVQWPNVCMGCIDTYHHRRPRGNGGSRKPSTSWVSNGCAICRACHSFIETRERGKAIELGFIVSQFAEPSEVKLFYRHERYALLDNDGNVVAA
ncbi:hypothetical protein BKG71_03650 [Mycobacteroides chelonae]|jgi:hypothetical protein|uniref:hypothetical protein n=1 Tax=Mycobacteroides chelonae TaxID=1774 RepID=UPI0008A930A2|nr:hypothetical protein [Mycobacteroides chelonae]MBF9523074.1 hypothetical protein [Mycobacteroides chelonae]MBF9523078.1 hypothetical protein [Mycobacteroides chelonae]OHT52539.1 hypothetical protein BKG63_10905 [Mycobacteroides chelonae]OHU02541.1 hypothetical protein BKG71_03650 [Mycobacteroides chelonae]